VAGGGGRGAGISSGPQMNLTNFTGLYSGKAAGMSERGFLHFSFLKQILDSIFEQLLREDAKRSGDSPVAARVRSGPDAKGRFDCQRAMGNMA